jgi:hypothetical protein
MNPPLDYQNHTEEEDFLYRPLFEVITLKKTIKKKKKKKVDGWVDRLYYTKPDYSVAMKEHLGFYNTESLVNSSHLNSSRAILDSS